MFDETAWDDGLDDAQLEAVTHGDGPLVVVAGAGTGKTRTLTSRVARLLERGVPPDSVLLLTFTRRAADDMIARAESLSGVRDLGRRLRGGTFHAVANQLVRSCAESFGLSRDYSLLDPSDAADLFDLLRPEHGLSGTAVRGPKTRTLVDIYSRCVNMGRQLSEVIATDFGWCQPLAAEITGICRAYVAVKRASGQLDFDDLLVYLLEALKDARLGPGLSATFDYVLVDEFQDLNALQVEIVQLLSPGGRGLTIVGDDAQAIYGFRGADARYLGEMVGLFDDATVVVLERNFRSTQAICDLANVVRPSDSGPRVTLRAERLGPRGRPVLQRCYDASAEARLVVDAILEAHLDGTALRDQAVLVRAAHHSDLIELELSARRVPYRKYGGLRFVEAAHVKDLASAFRVVANPSDDLAWFRIFRLHEGIGPASARRLLGLMRAGPARDGVSIVASAPARSRGALSRTLEALELARGLSSVAERVEVVCNLVCGLVPARYSDSTARAADLERLCDAASSTGDLAAWLSEITLDPPVSTGAPAKAPHLDEDYVVISTIHSAKGLEWASVFLPHLVDGAFPSDMALRSPGGIEEERRLFYVAVTRARDRLTLTAPLRMPHHRRAADDRHSLAPESRFLDRAALCRLEIRDTTTARPPVRARLLDRPDDPCQAGLEAASFQVSVDLDSLWS